ncbi:MAG: peptidylprolyl isomerase [Pirellulales bacterium]|nr:peptidylprolyl isomerase [Pirellulales bacterium]
MRFETSVGNIDMVLNPTNDANLQPLVDNMVAYIGLGRYHYTAINRAAEDFVLQMGGFLGFQPLPNLFAGGRISVDALTPVTTDANGDGMVDFSTLSNVRGEVSLALRAGDPNSGTSSFFINLGNNSFLDSQGFVPFARIENMTTIDRIMQLMQSDQSGGTGDLSLSDIPVLDSGRMVVVQRVFVLQADPEFSFVGPVATALELASRDSAAATATAAASESIEAAALAAIAPVPEPASVLLAGLAALGLFGARRFVR